MRAMTVLPGVADSARVEEVPEPDRAEGAVLVRGVALGVCGTDRDILAGAYGMAPPGRERLVLGHESMGVVEEAPSNSGLAAGDLVVGIVRHPDPVPCPSCAVGEWDMCRNGQYTEHGIKQRDGFCAEWWRCSPEFVVRLDPSLRETGMLLEPASVVAKAWEHTSRIGQRAAWAPRHVLVTGAGPIGLLAALLGVQRGLEVHVYDRVTEGTKPRLVNQLGATYHTGALDDLGFEPDIVMECTGAATVMFGVIGRHGANGIVCLTGVSTGGHEMTLDLGLLNRTMVLQNDVVFGSVNANRRHYELAAKALAAADPAWLHSLVTRRVPLDRWHEAFAAGPDDVKTVIEL